MKTINTLDWCMLLLLAACKKEDGRQSTAARGASATAGGQPRAGGQCGCRHDGHDRGDHSICSAQHLIDPDADTLTYSWVIASGPAGGTLTNATQAAASFQATAAGTYVLEVTVRDPGNMSSVDSLSLTLSSPPAPPAFGISGLSPHVVQGEVSTHRGSPAGASRPGRRSCHPAQQQSGCDRSARIDRCHGRRHPGVVQHRCQRDGHRNHNATAPGESPVTLDASVEPDLFDVVASSGDGGVMVGGTPVIGVTLRRTSSGGRRARLIDALECGACVARCD